MAASGVTVVYSFLYRGAAEEWSQQYHFVGDPPGTDADWISLGSALAALLLPTLASAVTVERMYCYEDTDDDSVYTFVLADHSVDGAGELVAGAGNVETPGDSASWVRWKTARTNSNGKPIYLRKYFHGVFCSVAGGDTDTLSSGYKSALEDFGGAVNDVSGDWPGIAGPDGVAPGASAASPFVTTRTLKRRGIRPH